MYCQVISFKLTIVCRLTFQRLDRPVTQNDQYFKDIKVTKTNHTDTSSAEQNNKKAPILGGHYLYAEGPHHPASQK